MKKLYVAILFIVFLNIVNVMFISLNIFNTGEPNTTDINETSGTEELVETWSGGDIDTIIAAILGDGTSLLVFAGGAVVSIIAAWATHSPAPFVVGIVGTAFLALYKSTMGIVENFPINNYIWLICTFGMGALFVITCAEYLTHGDV